MKTSGRETAERRPRASRAAFSLIELMISIVILAMVLGGVIYGYAQANRFAEWNSLSLAAQSYALQGLEDVRGAQWDLSDKVDSMPVPTPPGYTNFPVQNDYFDVPVTGAPIAVTNSIKLTQITIPSSSAQLRMVQSTVVWRFPLTGHWFTNTVTTYRAPDRE